jgi:uncharacterized protein
MAACDKYIDDDAYRLGNLLRTGLADLVRSPRLAAVREENRTALERASSCPWFAVCQGACPHDRYTRERRLPGAGESCCGLAPLFADIAERLPEAGAQAIHHGRRRR